MRDEKHLIVDNEVHTMAKTQAAEANMTVKAYLKLCLIRCKSDKSK